MDSEKTKWNQSRQWKRINELSIATWIVYTLYRVGAINELEKEMGKYNTDICAVQEIRWPGKETAIKRIVRLYIVDIKVTNMKLEQDFI